MPVSTSLRIGLTGGIGSGKSTVAAIFLRYGAPVIDFDKIARTLTQGENTPATLQIRQAFGDQVFQADGSLSRTHLRALVFQSNQYKQRLETILHPLIRDEAEHQYAALSPTAPIIIFDMPLLAEQAIWQKKLDKILVIDCDEATQIQRVIARSGWSEKQIKAVIATQATRAQRLAIATDVITNHDTSIQSLENQVFSLFTQWQQQNSQKPSV